MYAQAFFVAVFGLAAIGFGVVVFRTSSMVRSALALLFSQTAVGCMFLAMQTEFLGVLQIMMMATEMSIMAIFMVMFMMDPGGLGGMDMSHQKRFSIGAGAKFSHAVFLTQSHILTASTSHATLATALIFRAHRILRSPWRQV